MARAALDAALKYAHERESFGKAIVQHQAVGFRLADMSTKLDAARLMYLHAAAMKDGGEPCLREACQAKLFASSTVVMAIWRIIRLSDSTGTFVSVRFMKVRVTFRRWLSHGNFQNNQVWRTSHN